MKYSFWSNLKINDVSHYRRALMGVAIFGVMFSHWFGFQSIKSGIPFELSAVVVRLVFTEGLLFLSGFGLYYSFSKDQSIKSFYKRRIIRLYFPFVLMSLPLYSFFLVARDGYGIFDYLSQLSTAYFWFRGNYGGMWYVSLSILLYLLFPLLYRFLFSKGGSISVCTRTICCFVWFYLIIVAIKSCCGDYYSLVKIGVEKIPFFIIGVLFAHVVKNEMISQRTYRTCFLAIAATYLVLTIANHILPGYWVQHSAGIFQKLFFMPLLCLVFNILAKVNIGTSIMSFFDWFGKYSLELYILHLHFYMFFHYSLLNAFMPPMMQASLSMALALVLCRPVNKMIAYLTKKVS